jgi:hypothetical protein
MPHAPVIGTCIIDDAGRPAFEFQSVRRSFPRNLAENSEAASFLGQTTSC